MDFVRRHIGPTNDQIGEMCKSIGVSSLSELVSKTVPGNILTNSSLNLSEPLSEEAALKELKEKMSRNEVRRSFIGMGYYGTHTPPVIQRNILENPGWYTQYTPYQAEISQGRLEALLNFQTMVCDLTAMDVSNASLLDEGTAAAEAMALAFRARGSEQKNVLLISSACFPQTIDVVVTRAEPLGIKVKVTSPDEQSITDSVFAVLFQYPNIYGEARNLESITKAAHAKSALMIVAADILALTMLKPPGEWGADIVCGSTQRFGVPMGFGGPHAGYMAVRDEFKRAMPGRLIGVSKDSLGKTGLRLALQTREQHIRREKATSNICTAQVLLSIMASMYAVYHGPNGLKRIAERVNTLTSTLAAAIKNAGMHLKNSSWFDTLFIECDGKTKEEILKRADAAKINLNTLIPNGVGVALDETVTPKDLDIIVEVITGKKIINAQTGSTIPADLARKSLFLSHPSFNSYHSETELLRYITKLQSKDLSLCQSMIPLGSCTMKLNATAEMVPVTWSEVGGIHPFAPAAQVKGYNALIKELEAMLCSVTGFEVCSLQPNAGSQGEYAGLLAIRGYHNSRGDSHRNICLIPTSAHGTNPASAAMVGMEVVGVKCDENGNVDVADLKLKAAEHSKNLSALMVTYPSTHGVFEESITEICEVIHSHGGQVYMDGANMNAQVGLTSPMRIGADVCHLNLHKTFCIPHGGGGPGVGPILARAHLNEFMPGHRFGVPDKKVGPVASAPWGSASILPIPWMYIKMMGPNGLKEATEVAILNANYVARLLEPHYPILYKGKDGMVAHECIFDLRSFKGVGVEVEDVAKRLMDYGFHAPTVSWPVPGTLMFEPTESEGKAELDRFIEAMIGIREEIREIENGKADKSNNLLKNAPHTAEALLSDKWDRPYSRERAAYPVPGLRNYKFWPAVGRVDSVYGDKNLVCTCGSVADYASNN